jgi:hypothetical protein
MSTGKKTKKNCNLDLNLESIGDDSTSKLCQSAAAHGYNSFRT